MHHILILEQQQPTILAISLHPAAIAATTGTTSDFPPISNTAQMLLSK
jgi:hypothetical protein